MQYDIQAKLASYQTFFLLLLGSKIYNPCRGKTNTDNDCHSKLDHCEEYPVYMEDNCNLACCQLKHAGIARRVGIYISFHVKRVHVYGGKAYTPLCNELLFTEELLQQNQG